MKELELDGAVRFLGHVVPVQRAIEQAGIVVVPSLGEGFGMVALEAMERARPVIAAAIGGLGDIVRERETGLLVPPRNPDALAQAILRVVENPTRAKAMARAGRKRVETQFSTAVKVERTETLYRRLLEERGRS